ncbi:4Fe-4S binding protein [Zoogloea sp.]|uniref:4Fe-4S binding protein n=1 Tax=Zoogloea sp. TaxID=49181 RepID=UPI001ACD358A|nr:4Fe-4S binding protein [Zoogloea sp.]MBN8284577.1 4Fe-4S binding protein [Zoogloea sp.]
MDARRLLRRVASGAALLFASLGLPAQAGDLSHADIARRFQPPLHVGEKLRDIPAWPITSELEPEAGPVAYAFESIDLAPIPGFEGTPMNLLVSIDRKGNFMDVALLRQHEPVFLSGLGEGPLRDFLAQYANKSLKQEITVSSLYGNTRAGAGGNRVVLDGVSKATASVRIVNQTVLTSALAVARARLGFAAPAEKGPLAEVKADVFDRRSFAELLASGAIGRLHLSHADVEQRFAGSDGAGVDAEALARPDETFIDLYVAYLNAPTIGRAVLGEAGHADLMRRLEPGQHAWWVASAGRDAYIDEDFTRGTVPARLAFSQAGAPVELRDLDLSPRPPEGAPPLNAALVLRVPPMSGIDPASPVRFELTLTRARGSMLPVLTQRSVSLDYQAPEALFYRPPAPLPDWLLAWKERGAELGIIATALALLSVVLARPRWISVSARRLKAFRLAFLAFTLGYIGWYAQGQLSIVQITGAIKSLVAGAGLKSFLYDPVSLLLIAFTLVSFVVWGRGTFCGWLCPFGALQEFAALLARALRLPERKLPARLAGVLDRGRFVILAGLAALAAFAPSWAEKGVEVEPFKTAITVGFDRSAPFVAYALILLVLGGLYYKFFCRYLCPLGAAMALGGRLRLLDWLPRRKECGQPCQTCRHRCAYDAIEKSGAIRYERCFQCLDCVGIYHDAGRCAPIMLLRKKDRAPLRP